MNLHALVLSVLPTGLPGLRQLEVRRRISHKVHAAGIALPDRHAINDAIVELTRKRLVYSELRVDPEDGFRYRVYWREAAYVPPLDVEVH